MECSKEGEGVTLLWHSVCVKLPHFTAQHPRGPESSITWLWRS